MNASSRRSSRLRQGLLAGAAMVLSTGLVACGSSNSSTSTSTAAGSASTRRPPVRSRRSSSTPVPDRKSVV